MDQQQSAFPMPLRTAAVSVAVYCNWFRKAERSGASAGVSRAGARTGRVNSGGLGTCRGSVSRPRRILYTPYDVDDDPLQESIGALEQHLPTLNAASSETRRHACAYRPWAARSHPGPRRFGGNRASGTSGICACVRACVRELRLGKQHVHAPLASRTRRRAFDRTIAGLRFRQRAMIPHPAGSACCLLPLSLAQCPLWLASLYSSVVERQSCKLKVLGSIPSGGFTSWFLQIGRQRVRLSPGHSILFTRIRLQPPPLVLWRRTCHRERTRLTHHRARRRQRRGPGAAGATFTASAADYRQCCGLSSAALRARGGRAPTALRRRPRPP